MEVKDLLNAFIGENEYKIISTQYGLSDKVMQDTLIRVTDQYIRNFDRFKEIDVIKNEDVKKEILNFIIDNKTKEEDKEGIKLVMEASINKLKFLLDKISESREDNYKKNYLLSLINTLIDPSNSTFFLDDFKGIDRLDFKEREGIHDRLFNGKE